MLLSFQKYDLGAINTAGFRQTYDLRLEKALTTTARLHIFVRADDFHGSNESPRFSENLRTRQIQPVGELFINTETLQAQLRSERFDIRSETERFDSRRTIERTAGQLAWRPIGLPELTLLGQRNATNDERSHVELTDENLTGRLRYFWRGLDVSVDERYTRTNDPGTGYARNATMHGGQLTYATSAFSKKLTLSADAFAQLSSVEERSLDGGSSVRTPVTIGRTLWAVDDTPSDSRDHPPSPIPALNDGNLDASSGISIGPDGASFQNIVLDLGRNDRVDEIRILVRDPAGNPLRNGGGPVAWDVYTSEDGQLWVPVAPVQTTFNSALSLYAITFDQLERRWFKVVNFGVNVEATLITEVQAFYKTAIAPGGMRHGNLRAYNGTTLVSLQPIERLTLSLTTNYNATRQDIEGLSTWSTTDLNHTVAIEYTLRKTLALRTRVMHRDVTSTTGSADDADEISAFLDWTPTRELRVSFESTRQKQSLEGLGYTIDTEAIHSTAFFLRSLSVTLDAGIQKQTYDTTGVRAQRVFFNLLGNIQMFPSLRTTILASLQQNDSDDPAAQLLGTTRDQRIYADFIWRPGNPLSVSARYGYVSGALLSGFTQRYHVEWYPFGGGTVSLGGSYDQDIDPTTDRKATRLILNPRWVMNRWAAFDISYTSVRTSFGEVRNDQKTLFANLTLRR
ncbi:MAG TPA: discoidin domain-containing protein [Thermoanaerobaculia bacterium]|nr:discoidin domain-containing protein [Thermoanaerobaculia bacterium]